MTYNKILLFNLLIFIFIGFSSCHSPKNDIQVLRASLDSIIAPVKAKIGISFISIESNDTLTINNHHCYPTMSVYKFPLALAVLSEVEKGKINLNQRILIDKILLDKFSNCALIRQNPNMDNYMSVDSLIRYMICYSDNISTNVLFELIGGTESANNYIHNLGFPNIQIKYNIIQMTENPAYRYENCTKPSDMSGLLKQFYLRKILNKSNTDYLLNYMTNDSTTHRRILGDLPIGTVVAHKTGTSDTDENGNTTAVNDIGIITLPDGKQYALSVFVSDSKEDYETNEKIIAKISKLIYDYQVSNH